MLVDRNKTKIITADEAKFLSSAINEERELSFPVSVFVIGAVAGTIYRAQKTSKAFQPSFYNRFLAKINYSYASLVSFILWLGENNVDITAGVSENSKKDVLIVRLRPGCKVDLDLHDNNDYKSIF